MFTHRSAPPPARKSVRQSTSEHTRKTNLRLQERQDAPRRRRGAHRDRPLTQDELLAEAKITAEVNIRSLGEGELEAPTARMGVGIQLKGGRLYSIAEEWECTLSKAKRDTLFEQDLTYTSRLFILAIRLKSSNENLVL